MATAASSQGFSQGGIRSSDWFSETLQGHRALTSGQDAYRPCCGYLSALHVEVQA